MDEKLINVLSLVPKHILINCLEKIIAVKNDIINGVFVIPILSQEELLNYGNKVIDIKFPEFNQNYKGPYSMGGFGALGIASSFHHPYIRQIRKIVKKRFSRYIKMGFSGKYIEGFFDRFCVRNKTFGTIQNESWHQDILDPKSFKNVEFLDTDIMYGGWLNLNTKENQSFICVPKSQYDRMEIKVGFALVKNPDKINYYANLEKIITIPPGHAIFIQQGLVHRVNPFLPKQNSYRLFHGFRITESNKQLIDLESIFENLSVPLLPSGQVAPLYAKLHWVNARDKLNKFASNMDPKFTYDRVMKSGKDKGISYRVPGDKEYENIHSMKGLREHNVWTEEMYDYSPDDKLYFSPEMI